MSSTSRIARTAAAAAAFFIAGSAFADGTFTPELGFGQTSGKHVLSGDGTQRSRDPAFTAAFGYELENGFGARVMAIGDFDIQTAFGTTTYNTFDNFVGVQATGKYALADKLALRGGIGIGRSNLVGNGHELVTDGIVSIGLQWRPARHYAMEARYDRLTRTGTNLFSLQFQVPF
jgi:hypothetical protein